MTWVYVTGSNVYRRKFHASPECTQLTKGPATGSSRPVEKIDLGDLYPARPCKLCYPDAPVPRSAHRYCYTCDPGRTRPCEHNGGVRVFMTRVHRKGSLYRDPGEVFIQERYVWPERASHFVSA